MLFAAPATAQQFYDFDQIRVAGLAAPDNQIPKFFVTLVKQSSECLDLLLRQPRSVKLEKTLEHEIVLEQAAPAAPPQALEFGVIHCTRCALGPKHHSVQVRCSAHHVQCCTAQNLPRVDPGQYALRRKCLTCAWVAGRIEKAYFRILYQTHILVDSLWFTAQIAAVGALQHAAG